ncbi:hypothetical protein ACVBAX_04290 [Robertmurraya sp. GLU-23]|jgi:hypothetical protein|uniref:hypothetical protein n=1 Tax=Robertmurraya sp. TaxID=2837525 RepID=UPI000E6B4D9F|nr:hypothetical protein [Bacillus sp. Y1]AYA76562.1 hypothetical protein DOE78_14565 [Bacillus sp. Y1]
MDEILFDLTNFSTMYTIYASVVISLILRLVWIWNIEFQFLDTVCSSTDLSSEHRQLVYERTYSHQLHPALVWIFRYIRRKVAGSDDTDSTFPPSAR